MLRQRIPRFSRNPRFLEKIFHPHPYSQIRGSQSPLYKWWGGGPKYERMPGNNVKLSHFTNT